MPCHVDPDPPDPVKNPSIRHLTAYLCGVMRTLEEIDMALAHSVMAGFDHKGAGVPEGALQKWWQKHKKEDAIRKILKNRHKATEDLAKHNRRVQFEKLKAEFEPQEKKTLGKCGHPVYPCNKCGGEICTCPGCMSADHRCFPRSPR